MTVRRGVLALLLFAAVAAFYAAGHNGKSGDVEPTVTDSAVEDRIPADGSPNVLRQAEIGIDLASGWVASLAINGLTIPDDQLRVNAPLDQFFFTPGSGKAIERLNAGTVVVVASIWKPVDGETREDARQVIWQFRTI
jgi:ABC-type phosphate transport system substrate-binding protein